MAVYSPTFAVTHCACPERMARVGCIVWCICDNRDLSIYQSKERNFDDMFLYFAFLEIISRAPHIIIRPNFHALMHENEN